MIRINLKKNYFTGVDALSVWLVDEIILTRVVKNKKSKNVRVRTDEKTVTKRSKSVNMNGKTKSVYMWTLLVAMYNTHFWTKRNIFTPVQFNPTLISVKRMCCAPNSESKFL